MALQTPFALGPVRQGGQVLYVAYGADPYAFVNWIFAGTGTLTPVSNYSDAHGVACALWDAGGALAGTTHTVTAQVKT